MPILSAKCRRIEQMEADMAFAYVGQPKLKDETTSAYKEVVLAHKPSAKQVKAKLDAEMRIAVEK